MVSHQLRPLMLAREPRPIQMTASCVPRLIMQENPHPHAALRPFIYIIRQQQI